MDALHWTLAWSEAESIGISSVEQLDAQLRALHEASRGRPIVAEMLCSNGAAIAVGLGRDLTVLSFMPRPDPPYYASVGEPDAQGSVWFDYFGSPTEFPITQAIDLESAYAALAELFRTGLRPAQVPWSQV